MGRILKFFYLALGFYCLVSVFVQGYKHEYQQMVLSFFLALFNVGLYSLFKKEGSVPQLRMIKGGRS
ncbi:hypothetical protein [Bacillus sp. FJAT-27445]|uniref:hypothetical protein n=1 Tax=Bacillus sp. FJAT-27445 TaxID=1679166 RepID=UPI00074420E9|nr:hypothetical protein [Bacillus sp. FJAT-27445]